MLDSVWRAIVGMISGKDAEALDYIPMPANVVGMIKKTWATEIKSSDGKLVFEGK